MTFLLNKDADEYGEELEQVLKKDPSIMDQYHKNNGICHMHGGGENDFLQAIFQCFVRIEPLAKFFMTEVYREGAPEKKKFWLCDLIAEIFYSVNCDQV